MIQPRNWLLYFYKNTKELLNTRDAVICSCHPWRECWLMGNQTETESWRRCVSCWLIHPSLQAYGVPQGLPPPPFINTELHIHHLKVLSYSCGHADAGRADKMLKRHSATLWAVKSSRKEKQSVRRTIYHSEGSRSLCAQYNWANDFTFWTLIFFLLITRLFKLVLFSHKDHLME